MANAELRGASQLAGAASRSNAELGEGIEMTTWADEYMTLVDDCEKREIRLTEWEARFVNSIRHRLENEQPLSAKQTETLDKIWERVTSRG